MAMSESERAERRERQRELADRLKASGALDQIFEQIDAGEVLGGDEGLLKGMLKAALERGLEVELSDHVGYERGAPEASAFPNSRNGTSPKTVATEVAEEVLAWQRRPLEPLYPVIYLDAIVVKVRDGGHVGNKAAHLAVGVDMDGVKHVLGIWVQTTEGAK